MLSATRRRVLPASLLVTAALGASVLTATIPAQAATSSVTTSVASSVATTTTLSLATSATSVSAAALTPAQVATAALTSAIAARNAAARARAAVAAARVARVRGTAVRVARSRIGSRYVAGRSGPHAFDCSGLALYVVRLSTGRSLPHYSRAQFAATKRVAKNRLRPGDLVFFFGHGAHHVGVYIGGGRMVSATNPRGGVRVDSVFSGWYGSRYSGAGRLA